MIRMLAALWRLVVDAVADVLEWARRPGSKLKVICATLAAAAAFGAVHSYTQGLRIAALRQQIVFIEADCETRIGGLREDVDERDRALAQIAEALRAEAAKLEAVRAESAAALGQLAADLEQAERDAASWTERYRDRPDTCQAALELLDSACPSLGGY